MMVRDLGLCLLMNKKKVICNFKIFLDIEYSKLSLSLKKNIHFSLCSNHSLEQLKNKENTVSKAKKHLK